jgi:monoamine oxidase
VRRRDALKLGGVALSPGAIWAQEPAHTGKRVIVAGAGLAGLVCAYELMKWGHDVTVLEASGRTGGHIRTVREGLDDGLYADAGAEHFTKPGYELCWSYFAEFDLPVLFYPHREAMLRVVDGRMMTQDEALVIAQRKSADAPFNQRELDYLKQHPSGSLSGLYLKRYIEAIKDEYQPFGVGLDDLDAISLSDLLRRDGASDAAIRRIGSNNSALHAIWKLAILRLRDIPTSPRDLYRVQGGNEMLPSALAQRLGNRIRFNSAVSAIRHDSHGVTVTCGERTLSADYLVCCMNAIMLRRIPVKPAWSELKQYALENISYTIETRLIFQSKTKFWRTDHNSGNLVFGNPILGEAWPMAEEVRTQRGLLIGNSQASVKAEMALAVFQKYYSGKSADIERAIAVDWSHDPWAMACESRTYQPGQLRKIWPAVIEPAGRVFFAGAYCDNQSWGMEAASRSGYRAAKAIHES